jgi:hypothetical protein
MKTLMCFIAVMVFSVSVLAQSDPQIPSWVPYIIGLLNGIPYVGPVFIFIAKWGGLLAGLFTALSVAVQSVLKVPELILVWTGAQTAADKVKALSDKILPYLQYLSIFNVQKK